MSKLTLPFLLGLLGLTIAGCGTPSLGAPSDAATVNGAHISMADYSMQVAYQRHLAALGSGGVDPCQLKVDGPICAQLKRTTLNDLIDEELVRQYAARHHIAVTPAEFQAQWIQVMAARFNDNVPVMHAWLKRFSLSESALKGMVRDDLLQQKVMYAVTEGMPTAVPAVRMARIAVQTQQQLQQARSMLKRQSFLQVAALLRTNHESLCYEVGCGELGWLPNAFLSPVERAAATARPGTILGPFANQQGLSIVLVEGHQSHYMMNATQQLAMRRQLFAGWVQRLQTHASIHRYVTV